MRIRVLPIAVMTVGMTMAACAGEREGGPAWQSQRETRGDTTIVTTTSGSVWPASGELVEELRIGALEGPEELIFGRIDEIAPDAEGGVYVFDGQAPALRYYDASGSYVRTLGRDGSGPGEYRDVALGLAVRSDGRIVMRDPRNNRLNVYEPDGSPSDHWPVASGLFTSQAMVVDTADHMYLKILLGPPERNRPWAIGLLHLDDNGVFVDTIPDPAIDGEPTEAGGTFLPAKVWVLTPHRDMVVGVPREYT
ncbi:MAG: 6-bladed beta-propeller, partial [Longimicrobiales bacterium]